MGGLITIIVIQMIVYCIMFLWKYSEAKSEFNRRIYRDKYKLEFLKFRETYKWWHFMIPFYWVYTLVIGIIKGVKELER